MVAKEQNAQLTVELGDAKGKIAELVEKLAVAETKVEEIDKIEEEYEEEYDEECASIRWDNEDLMALDEKNLVAETAKQILDVNGIKIINDKIDVGQILFWYLCTSVYKFAGTQKIDNLYIVVDMIFETKHGITFFKNLDIVAFAIREFTRHIILENKKIIGNVVDKEDESRMDCLWNMLSNREKMLIQDIVMAIIKTSDRYVFWDNYYSKFFVMLLADNIDEKYDSDIKKIEGLFKCIDDSTCSKSSVSFADPKFVQRMIPGFLKKINAY